jgi:hypothetical protein
VVTQPQIHKIDRSWWNPPDCPGFTHMAYSCQTYKLRWVVENIDIQIKNIDIQIKKY